MKFCSECKKLYNGADTICAECNKKYKEIVDINEPVMLCVTGGVERNMICGALKDAQIPFVEKQYGKAGVSNEIITGYDAKLLNIAIEVPYSAIPKAFGILKSLSMENESLEQLIDQVELDVSKYKEQYLENETKMSNAKRTTIKVISAIAFLILAAAVVLGTDYIMEFFKGLLGG